MNADDDDAVVTGEKDPLQAPRNEDQSVSIADIVPTDADEENVISNNEDEESLYIIEENRNEPSERGEQGAPPSADEENAISIESEGRGEVIEENTGASQDRPELDQDFSVAELTTLPIASPVPVPLELLNRLRELQEQQRDRERQIPNIPHALPHNVEAEARASRHNRMLYMGMGLIALALVAIVIGVTVGMVNRRSEPVGPISQEFIELQQLIASVSFDGGAALEDEESPQYRALLWLANNANLQDYPEGKRIQRYVLAVLYYSMNGDDWVKNDGWLSDEDECSWYRKAQGILGHIEICHLNTTKYGIITLANMNMDGTIPPELALLSNTLGK